MNQDLVEQGWLYYAHHVASDGDRDCLCKPTSSAKYRWPGYIGPRYAERRVLFLGAIHKPDRIFPDPAAGFAAKKASDAMKHYEQVLAAWSSRQRSVNSDAHYLVAMRDAHDLVMIEWAKQGVWQIFNQIRKSLTLGWDQIAFSNLARCHDPSGDDDSNILSCNRSYPIGFLIGAIQPRIVFLAKTGIMDILIQIPGEESRTPLVVRYSNHSTGKRNGLHYSVWIPQEAPVWRRLLGIDAVAFCDLP